MQRYAVQVSALLPPHKFLPSFHPAGLPLSKGSAACQVGLSAAGGRKGVEQLPRPCSHDRLAVDRSTSVLATAAPCCTLVCCNKHNLHSQTCRRRGQRHSARCPPAVATAGAAAAAAAASSSSGSTMGSGEAPTQERRPWLRPTARRRRRWAEQGWVGGGISAVAANRLPRQPHDPGLRFFL